MRNSIECQLIFYMEEQYLLWTVYVKYSKLNLAKRTIWILKYIIDSSVLMRLK